jgi:hypothetical protein
MTLIIDDDIDVIILGEEDVITYVMVEYLRCQSRSRRWGGMLPGGRHDNDDDSSPQLKKTINRQWCGAILMWWEWRSK